MVDTKSKIYLSWGDIDLLMDALISTIDFEVTSVMGLARGGLIPAVILSHRLNVPLVSVPLEDTLIVDDICDSGNTFLEIYKQYPNLKFACLHFKPHTSVFNPTTYATTFNSDDWIVYPWERDDADAIQDYLK